MSGGEPLELTGSAAELAGKIRDRSARIAVVGMGYVGLPLAVEFARAGFHVTGIDVAEDRVEGVNRGESHVGDVDPAVLKQLVSDGFLKASKPGEVLAEADAISICVPTPLRKSKDPDISYIVSATEEVARHLHAGQLVVLESTTYPGTTEEVILPRLSEGGLKVGEDFFLAFSPERVDPGNRDYHTRNTPKVVGGVTPVCNELAKLFYGTAIETVVSVSGTHAAEMVKLLENTFRSVNIGLVNEIAIMCQKLGVEVWEVIDAAATKPFGFMPFWPGPGLGGHCIPIDPHYLSWKLKTLDYNARFIELADEINSSMPEYVVELVEEALSGSGKSLDGSSVMLLGLAYKRDVSDCRESPALDIIGHLRGRGARVTCADPHVPSVVVDGETFETVECSAGNLADADCVVIVTDHEEFDPEFVIEHSRMVVDTRNKTRGLDPRGRVRKL